MFASHAAMGDFCRTVQPHLKQRDHQMGPMIWLTVQDLNYSIQSLQTRRVVGVVALLTDTISKVPGLLDR